MSELTLPPQPKLKDFIVDGKTDHAAFQEATRAWREVCREVLASQRSNAFWGR